MSQSIAQITERNIALYNALNDIDDRRERLLKAASTGRHEPSSIFGGLYDVEEVDDGGRLIERRERGIESAFIPVAELPTPSGEALESEQAPILPIANAETSEAPPHDVRIEEIRYLLPRTTSVILRRRTTLHAI